MSARHRIRDFGAALRWGRRALDEALTLPLPALERMGERGREIVTPRHDATSEAEKLSRLFAASEPARLR